MKFRLSRFQRATIARFRQRTYSKNKAMHAWEEDHIVAIMCAENEAVGTADLVRRYPDRFDPKLLHQRVKTLAEQGHIVGIRLHITRTALSKATVFSHYMRHAPIYGPLDIIGGYGPPTRNVEANLKAARRGKVKNAASR